MEWVAQVLGENVVSTTRKVVSGMTPLCRSESVLSTVEEVAKRLVTLGPEDHLFKVSKRLLGASGGTASVAISLEITIDKKTLEKGLRGRDDGTA